MTPVLIDDLEFLVWNVLIPETETETELKAAEKRATLDCIQKQINDLRESLQNSDVLYDDPVVSHEQRRLRRLIFRLPDDLRRVDNEVTLKLRDLEPELRGGRPAKMARLRFAQGVAWALQQHGFNTSITDSESGEYQSDYAKILRILFEEARIEAPQSLKDLMREALYDLECGAQTKSGIGGTIYGKA